MTQSVAVLDQHQESLSQRAARRLRGALAENRISGTDLARALHLPQQKVSRKVNGQTPLTLDEIQLVAEVLGVSVDAILGTGEWAERAIGWCAIRDSNPEPADSVTPRPLSIVGRIPLGAPVPAPPKPETPRRHLQLVRRSA